jgi:hypothetical protein
VKQQQEPLKKQVEEVPKKATRDGLLGYGTGVDLAAGFAAAPLLGSLMGGDEAPEVRKEKLNVNYPKVKDLVTKFKIRDYSTGKDNQLDVGESVEERLGDNYVSRYKHGGIARFNSGDLVNKLPSKTQYDEKDYSVYTRAANFVTDESGNGDEDEDTMLAQLADGEFVTTAKAVLGAGIIAGASPSDKTAMRDKGAKYFYEQQARFKRVYKLLNDAKKRTNSVQ